MQRHGRQAGSSSPPADRLQTMTSHSGSLASASTDRTEVRTCPVGPAGIGGQVTDGRGKEFLASVLPM